MKHLLLAALLLLPTAALGAGAYGGSGLLDIDQAYDLRIGRPLLSIHGSIFGEDAGDDAARLFSLVPAFTWGLGGGFEASVSLPLEGLSYELPESTNFGRRFDLRRGDPRGRLRYVRSVAGDRMQVGVQGLVQLGIGDSNRPGSTKTLDLGLDHGVELLASTNIGAFSFPVRVHANAGYWFSREDGSFWYPHLSRRIELDDRTDTGNDVFSTGIAVEMGFRRAVVFAELLSEQFVEARGQLSSRENLWRFTPGVRTKLGSNVELTLAASFDLSEDDPATSFNPDVAYPDTEFRAAVSLGAVLGRENEEARRRERARQARLEREAAIRAAQEAAAEPAAESTESTVTVVVTPVESEAERFAKMESRLRELEMSLRLAQIENRIAFLELRPGGMPMAKVQGDSVAAMATPFVGPTAREMALARQLEALRAQLAESQAKAAAEAAAQPPAQPVTEPAAQPAETPAETPAEEPADKPAEEQAQEVAAKPATESVEKPMEIAAAAKPVEEEAIVPAEPATEKSVAKPVEPTAEEPVAKPIEEPAAQPVATSDTRLSRGGGTTTVLSGQTAQSAGEAEVEPDEEWIALMAEARALAAEKPTQRAKPSAEIVEQPAEAVVAEATPTPVEAVVEPSFSLEIAGRAELAGNLDSWVEELQAFPSVQLAILAWSDQADLGEALRESEERAAFLRDGMIIAGANPEQLVALGMGQRNAGDPAGEVVERLR